MMGDRYGTVTFIKSNRVYVKLDKSRKRFAFDPDRVKFAK